MLNDLLFFFFFFQNVLIKMGFAPCWIALVMNFFNSISYSILLNGKMGPWFKPSHGLREGDPLSPFLFLFVMDVLSKMMIKACQSQLLHPTN